MNQEPYPFTLVGISPQLGYHVAGRAMADKARELGAAEAEARFAPRRLGGGWWSPLFAAAVLEVPHA